jgi:aquaporin Z
VINAKKLLVEAIGTFFLVLTVGLVGANAGELGGLAIGAVLMVMVYAGGQISGAHYNPAVTTAVWLRGRATTADWFAYVVAQLVGAAAAAGVVIGMLGRGDAPFSPAVAGEALLAEFLFTFALAYVVLHVATSKSTEGNSYFGLAIGFTVLAGAYAVGAISGGAFNPAVTVGSWVTNAFDVGATWPYLLVQLGAGAGAALVFRVVAPSTETEAEAVRQATPQAAAQPGA